MKLLFFSCEREEVEEVRKEFVDAGIPCEVHAAAEKARSLASPDAEVWIQNDRDSHRAFLLCVERGVGFARRSPNSKNQDCLEAKLARWNAEELEEELSKNRGRAAACTKHRRGRCRKG